MGVGVIVDPKDPRSLEAAAVRLSDMLTDPDVANRCRRAAEHAYSLEAACAQQTTFYRDFSP
jgi:hypothetical protein